MTTGNKPHIAIATIGHIDHGKSTLLGRLLYDSNQVSSAKKREVKAKGGNYAFYLDALEEEQKQGITIDAVYAEWESPKYKFTFIDDPGHKEFIKNMLTGASQADGAILLVSAHPKEKIQAQTKRHLNIIKMLGIEQLLVVINKMDTVEYEEKIYTDLKKELMRILKGIGYASKEVLFIPTSAEAGDNVYKEKDNLVWFSGPTFAEALDNSFMPPKPAVNKPLRGTVQKVLESQKLIVTKIIAGKLNRGQKISFALANTTAKVKELNLLGKSVETATVGDGVGIKIEKEISNVARGDVISDSGKNPKTSTELNGKIFVLSPHGLEKGTEIVFRSGTKETHGQIKAIEKRIDSETGKILGENAKKIEHTNFALVALELEEKVAYEDVEKTPELGRFILTRKGQNIAAGIIT